MSHAAIGGLVICLLFGLFSLGIEIGFAMALAGFIGFAAVVNTHAAMNLLAKDVFSVLTSYGFTVIPLFVLMGQIGASGGVARGLYDCAYRFLGHIPGGLAIGTVAAATGFKAICGSSPATAATFATVAVPEMDRYGYDKRLSCGTVATVGTLGVLIPPSVTLIVYGILTETSIGRLFLAGIIPGLLIACSFVVTLYTWCRINPALGPAGERSGWPARLRSLGPIFWVLLVFLLVVGGLMKGFFTPTEAGSVGSFAVLLLTVAKREMTPRRFAKAVLDALRIATMVITMIAGATIMGHFFVVTRIPATVAEWLGGLDLPRFVIMLIIIAVYLDRGLLHRGPGLPHPGHADLPPPGSEDGLRPGVVRRHRLGGDHDRHHPAAGGHQRLRGRRRHGHARRHDLPGHLPAHPGDGRLPAHPAAGSRHLPLAARHVHEMRRAACSRA